MNIIVVFGFKVPFVTSTFGLDGDDGNSFDNPNKFGEIKAMLFSSSIIYFLLAFSLEFMK